MRRNYAIIAGVVVMAALGGTIIAGAAGSAQVIENLNDLKAQQLDHAEEYYEATFAAYENGTVTFQELLSSSRELFSARHAVASTQEERIKLCSEYVDRQAQYLARVDALFKVGGRGGEAEKLALAKLTLVKAKILLAEEVAKQ
jgi:hypothetical protein